MSHSDAENLNPQLPQEEPSLTDASLSSNSEQLHQSGEAETSTFQLPPNYGYFSASKGKRFANYLIDTLVFYFVIMVASIIYYIISPEQMDSLDSSSSNGVDWGLRLILMVCYGLYYSIMEAAFNGRTLGKYITGTKVFNLDGSDITLNTAFRRGFSRVVPFEVFSALGDSPWHDRWTDTTVVDLKRMEQEQRNF